MRLLAFALVVSLIGCGGSTPTSSGPRDETAAERGRREAAASGETDVGNQGRSWGGWRYSGTRDACFYVVGRTCFDALPAACKAASCQSAAPEHCRTEGGGPATVRCR